MHTVFVSDFDARISQIAERGLEPAERETYDNGVRKATFRDRTATRSDSAAIRPDRDGRFRRFRVPIAVGPFDAGV